MNGSFDTIAPAYASLERLTFGSQLQNARTGALRRPHPPIKRALLLGDGNGSFALELLRRHPLCQIDSIDISQKMLEISQRRIAHALAPAPYAYNPILADARRYDFKHAAYDFVGLHFFLDCFNHSDCAQLIDAATRALEPGGILSFADFSIPAKQPYRGAAQLLVRALYFGFNLLAGLQTQRLPTLLWPACMTRIHSTDALGGLLTNQIFTKNYANTAVATEK